MDRPPSRGGPPRWSPEDAGGPSQPSPHDDPRGRYDPGRFPAQRPSPVPPSSGPMTGGSGYGRHGYHQGYNPGYGNCPQPSRPTPVHSYSRGGVGSGTAEWSDNARRRNNNTNNAPKPKRAAKRRVKHDLPGPAGVWFRQQKRKKAARTAMSAKKAKKEEADANPDHGKGNVVKEERDNVQQSDNNLPENGDGSEASSPTKRQEKQEQLFHDHSADLHECQAWNLMCQTLDRIVPTANTLLAHQNAFTAYKRVLRREVEDTYALIHEIHEGRYDANHIASDLHDDDLRIPLLVGYVASVQCHAHSDWTALLVDEMHSVAANTSKHGYGAKGANSGRGIVCWIEERLVKEHAHWVRPGVVWMIEGARLALFASPGEDDDDEEIDAANVEGGYGNAMGAPGTDVSPSTDAARGGGAIDRVVLVGESSLVYAWTPEEAKSAFGKGDFNDLTSRRNGKVKLESSDEAVEVDEEAADDAVTIVEAEPDPRVADSVAKTRAECNPLMSTGSNGNDPSTAGRSDTAGSDVIDAIPSLSKGHRTDVQDGTTENGLAKETMPQSAAQMATSTVEQTALEADSATNTRALAPMPRGNNAVTQSNPYQKVKQGQNAQGASDNMLNAPISAPSQPGKAAEALSEEALMRNTAAAAAALSSNPNYGQKTTNTTSPLSTSAAQPILSAKTTKSQINGAGISNEKHIQEDVSKTTGMSIEAAPQRKARAKAKQNKAGDDDRLGLFQFLPKKTPPRAIKAAPKQGTDRANEITTQALAANTVPVSSKEPELAERAVVSNEEQADDGLLGRLRPTGETTTSASGIPAPNRVTQSVKGTALPPKSSTAEQTSTALDQQPAKVQTDSKHSMREALNEVTAQVQSKDSFNDMLDEDEEILAEASAQTGKTTCLTPKIPDKPNPQPHIGTGDCFDDMLDENELDTMREEVSTRSNEAEILPQKGEERHWTPKACVTAKPHTLDTGDSFDDMLDEDDPGPRCAATVQKSKALFRDSDAFTQSTPLSVSTTMPPDASKDKGKSFFDALDEDDDMDFLGEDD